MSNQFDVIVIGGGVVGASCAYHLQEAGKETLILEADQPASKASGRAAGHLQTYSSGKFERKIAEYCIDFHKDLADKHAAIVLYRDTDYVLAHSKKGVENLKRIQKESTASLTYLDQNELVESAPALDAPSIQAGLRFENAIHTDPHSVTTALVDDAVNAGATLQLERVIDFDITTDDWNKVHTEVNTYCGSDIVIAAGAWTKRLAEYINIQIPLRPRTSQIVILEPPSEIDFPMFHAPDLELYGRQEPNGDILIGGGSTTPIPDPNDFTTDARESFIQQVASQTEDLTTKLKDAGMVDNWAGRCSATPDRNPLIGPSNRSDIYLCAGFNGGGIARAPFAGRLISDYITDEKPIFDPEPFHPDRFDGDDEFAIKSASTNW